jgi:hypothetical protein
MVLAPMGRSGRFSAEHDLLPCSPVSAWVDAPYGALSVLIQPASVFFFGGGNLKQDAIDYLGYLLQSARSLGDTLNAQFQTFPLV